VQTNSKAHALTHYQGLAFEAALLDAIKTGLDMLHPGQVQSAVERATVWPWVVDLTYRIGEQPAECLLRIVESAGRPDEATLLAIDAQVVRCDMQRGDRLQTMPTEARPRYRRHHIALQMWAKARALSKAVETLQPWVDYDPILIDETTERWVCGGAVRYSGG
jgi:hypothetical protein